MDDDQQVTITLANGEQHTATGGPVQIAAALQMGDEVICHAAGSQYVLRVLPFAGGVALTYDEAVL